MTVEQAISYLTLMKDKTEPVFMLMGHDNLTPATIWYWIQLAENCGVPEVKITGAVEVRRACLAWPVRKFPD